MRLDIRTMGSRSNRIKIRQQAQELKEKTKESLEQASKEIGNILLN